MMKGLGKYKLSLKMNLESHPIVVEGLGKFILASIELTDQQNSHTHTSLD